MQLLLGEVPERVVFNQKGFIVALSPYLALTQAVRQGDLVEFNRVVQEVNRTACEAKRCRILTCLLSQNESTLVHELELAGAGTFRVVAVFFLFWLEARENNAHFFSSTFSLLPSSGFLAFCISSCHSGYGLCGVNTRTGAFR